MRMRDWISDVCSSDLFGVLPVQAGPQRAGNHPEDVRAGPLPTFLEKSRPREEPGRSAAADLRAPHLDPVAALLLGQVERLVGAGDTFLVRTAQCHQAAAVGDGDRPPAATGT